MTDLMTPFITISGDKRETLIKDRVCCMVPLRETLLCLSDTKPHGRNYIGQPEAYERDLKIYKERRDALEALLDALLEETLAIQSGDAA